jgi:acyl carrier protein
MDRVSEMTQSDVFPKLRAMIADSLAVDEAGVTLQSRLIDDLGADSLDFVDLVFAIEHEFGVKLREADLNFLGRLDFSSPTVLKDGHLTAETIQALSPLLPALQHATDRDRITPGQLFSMLTVESLCLMIERRILDG